MLITLGKTSIRNMEGSVLISLRKVEIGCSLDLVKKINFISSDDTSIEILISSQKIVALHGKKNIFFSYKKSGQSPISNFFFCVGKIHQLHPYLHTSYYFYFYAT